MGLNFKKSSTRKEKPRLEVTGRNSYSLYMPQEVPDELKSTKYHLQAVLGLLGIIFVFASFIDLYFLILGLLCIYGRSMWRKKTDFAAKNYRDAVDFYKKGKYEDCIQAINHVLSHPNAPKALVLTQAECFLELEKLDEAYNIYQSFFTNKDSTILSSMDYWPAKTTTIAMAVDNEDYDFALKLLDTLPNEVMDDINFPLWKNYYKGLCFLGKQQYEPAIETFNYAIGKKKKMQEPYIDCHYRMGIAYARLGKTTLAQQQFQKVFSANASYKNIRAIIAAIEAGESLKRVLEKE